MSRRRLGFSVIELLVVSTIIVVLLALTLAAVQKARSSAARSRCQNNLKQICLALANYEANQGKLPFGWTPFADSKMPGIGWEPRLLPYLEQNAVWTQSVDAFISSKEWYPNAGSHPISTVIGVYGCPADSRVQSATLARTSFLVATTSYLGVSGTRSALRNGSLFAGDSVRFIDITDGCSNTIILGERPPSFDMWFGWWYASAGTDLSGTADAVLGVQESTFSTDPSVQGCSGPSFFHEGNLSEPCDVFHYWSLHSGGANFAFADGSVRFLSYSAKDVLPSLATRAGNEIFSPPY